MKHKSPETYLQEGGRGRDVQHNRVIDPFNSNSNSKCTACGRTGKLEAGERRRVCIFKWIGCRANGHQGGEAGHTRVHASTTDPPENPLQQPSTTDPPMTVVHVETTVPK